MSNSPFLQSIREHMQVQRYSQRTIHSFIHTYIYWIRDYIRFNNLAHPKTLTSENVTQHLTYLACKRNVASATPQTRLLLNELSGVYYLLGALIYGSGLRRIESVRLRVKDIDFDHLALRIWNGKGGDTNAEIRWPNTLVSK
jgi:integrase